MESVSETSEDEFEEASMLDDKDDDMEDALESFRHKWQQELKSPLNNPANFKNLQQKNNNSFDEENNYESMAKKYFLKGAELEKCGDFYAAIQYYKRAVQLVPDIEFRISQKLMPKENKALEESFDECRIESEEDDEEQSIKNDLLAHIQRKLAKNFCFCVPAHDQRWTHISKVPMEILLYIFKWVVSSDLDLRSLEMCSLVCRGFFLCARDDEIWRLACLRVWGGNCGYLNQMYPNWREMYIHRARLHYNGCYISRTTYIRHGENSFQDQFYRPWHLVAYYRYLRFFPEGLVFMLTTPDEPQHCVSLLKTRTPKTSALLRGHYRLKDDRVLLVLHDMTRQQYNNKKKSKLFQDSVEQTFHLEFQIVSHAKRKHMQLLWVHYSVLMKYPNGNETQSAFDVSSNRYPPLWFSRVKSYTKETANPLV